MQQGKTGVLLVNLGTPDSFQKSDVKKYLLEFLLDERVIDIPTFQRNLLVRGAIIPKRAAETSATYKKIWTKDGSPLLMHSRNLAKAVAKVLGDDFDVELVMRYQSPSIADGLEKLRLWNVQKIIIFPLFPQYASATTGSIHQRVMELVSKWQVIPELKFINSYYDNPQMISAFVDRSKQFDFKSFDQILFSYHGLPVRQIKKADQNNFCLTSTTCCDQIDQRNAFCYRAQCFATTRALAAAIGIEPHQYTICFQSRLGKEEWIQPYASETIVELAKQGKKRLLVFSPAFVADCIETIHEIAIEYRDLFIDAGGKDLQMVESLNDHPLWVQAVADLIRKN